MFSTTHITLVHFFIHSGENVFDVSTTWCSN